MGPRWRTMDVTWRECCAMASGWLTRAYHGVSLETDFSKSRQHNFLVYCIRKSEDLQHFRSECLFAQAARSTLEPGSKSPRWRTMDVTWRECCAMASGWLTRAYHGVSLETDFSKSRQHNFLVYCIRKSEDLQDFRSECLLAQAAAQHSNQAAAGSKSPRWRTMDVTGASVVRWPAGGSLVPIMASVLRLTSPNHVNTTF